MCADRTTQIAVASIYTCADRATAHLPRSSSPPHTQAHTCTCPSCIDQTTIRTDQLSNLTNRIHWSVLLTDKCRQGLSHVGPLLKRDASSWLVPHAHEPRPGVSLLATHALWGRRAHAPACVPSLDEVDARAKYGEYPYALCVCHHYAFRLSAPESSASTDKLRPLAIDIPLGCCTCEARGCRSPLLIFGLLRRRRSRGLSSALTALTER